MFLGEVAEKHLEKTVWEHGVVSFRYRLRFRVLQTWKGPKEPFVSLETGTGGGDCGYPFRVGTPYLVFAFTNEAGILETGICSGNRGILLDSAGLRELGQPVQTFEHRKSGQP